MQIATVKIETGENFVDLLDVIKGVVPDFEWGIGQTYLIQNRGTGNVVLAEAEEIPDDSGEGLLLCSYKGAVYKPTTSKGMRRFESCTLRQFKKAPHLGCFLYTIKVAVNNLRQVFKQGRRKGS